MQIHKWLILTLEDTIDMNKLLVKYDINDSMPVFNTIHMLFINLKQLSTSFPSVNNSFAPNPGGQTPVSNYEYCWLVVLLENSN